MSSADPSRDAWLTFGADSVTLRTPDGSRDSAPLVHGGADLEMPDLAVAQALLTARPGGARGLRVLISEAWLAAVELPWSDALLGDSARGFLDLQFTLLGIDSADLEVTLDDAAAGEPRLALALPAAWRAALDTLASAHGYRLLSIAPLAVQVHGALDASPGVAHSVLAVVENSAITLLVASGGRVRQAQAYRYQGDWSHELSAAWRRLKLRDPALASVPRIDVVNLSGVNAAARDELALLEPGDTDALLHSAGSGALEFLRRQPPLRHWQWASAAMLALLIGGSGWWALSAQRDAARAEAALQALHAPSTNASASSSAAGGAARVDAQELATVKRQLASLDVPIDRLLAAALPPSQVRATLLSFEMSAPRDAAAAATLRLTGEARSSAAMTEYLAHLGSTAPFTGAELTRHELAGAAYRFTMEATWKR